MKEGGRETEMEGVGGWVGGGQRKMEVAACLACCMLCFLSLPPCLSLSLSQIGATNSSSSTSLLSGDVTVLSMRVSREVRLC
jgi:hypothetical protein